MWVGEEKGPFPRLLTGTGGGTSSVDWKNETEGGRERGREGEGEGGREGGREEGREKRRRKGMQDIFSGVLYHNSTVFYSMSLDMQYHLHGGNVARYIVPVLYGRSMV